MPLKIDRVDTEVDLVPERPAASESAASTLDMARFERQVDAMVRQALAEQLDRFRRRIV